MKCLQVMAILIRSRTQGTGWNDFGPTARIRRWQDNHVRRLPSRKVCLSNLQEQGTTQTPPPSQHWGWRGVWGTGGPAAACFRSADLSVSPVGHNMKGPPGRTPIRVCSHWSSSKPAKGAHGKSHSQRKTAEALLIHASPSKNPILCCERKQTL